MGIGLVLRAPIPKETSRFLGHCRLNDTRRIRALALRERERRLLSRAGYGRFQLCRQAQQTFAAGWLGVPMGSHALSTFHWGSGQARRDRENSKHGSIRSSGLCVGPYLPSLFNQRHVDHLALEFGCPSALGHGFLVVTDQTAGAVDLLRG